jgi:hypothetical protein
VAKRRYRRFEAAVALAVVLCATAASASVASPTACALVTDAKARAIVGYAVKIRRGDTAADCVIVATPVRLDSETLYPIHPTIDFSVFADGSRPRSFAQELRDARRRGFGPVPGFGSNSYLVAGPQSGAFGVYAKIRGTVLNMNVGPSKRPLGRAQALAFAHRLARGL